MKKLIAIFLLINHLYNLGGYFACFQISFLKASKFAEAQISKGLYKADDLVEIKIPVSMPTSVSNWSSYEPVSGVVELQGGQYNYVKLKITRDTIYAMCVPNYKTTKLLNANIIFAKHVSDSPLNAKKQNILLKGVSLYKYIPLASDTNLLTPKFVKIEHYRADAEPVNTSIDVPGQPPETALA